MKRNSFVTIIGAFVMAASAQADWISSWGQGTSNPPNPDFAIDQFAGTITILRGNGNAYKFYSETSLGSGSPGSINNITIDPGATGNCTLLIDSPNTGQAGALNWRAGNLTYAGGACTVVGINLSGNLCLPRNSPNDPINVICSIINGSINVAGTLSQPVGNGVRDLKLEATEIHGDITLGGMVGDINTGLLNGNVTIGQTPLGATHGDIRIGVGLGVGYSGTIQINDTDPVGYDGRIHIGGDLTGHIHLGSYEQWQRSSP